MSSKLSNQEVQRIAKLHGLDFNYPKYNSYIDADDNSVARLNNQLKRKIKNDKARTVLSDKQQSTEKEPLITPIKARHKRFNFTENILK